LIAARIYAASQPFHISGEDGYGVEAGKGGDIVGGKKGGKYEQSKREKYLAMIWIIVESGAVYSTAAIVQLVTYLLKMNAGVIMEFMLGQLSAMVPVMIVVRVGLGLAYQGASIKPHPTSSALSFHVPNSGAQLSTFQAASHHNNNNNSDTDLHNHQTGLVTSSSGTKLDTETREGTESKVTTDDDDNSNVYMDRTSNSGERNGEKERGEDNGNVKVSESAGGVIMMS